jgi:hypothetical protein
MSFSDILRRQIDRKEWGKKQFLELVEFHQKAWGTDTYKGQPTLNQLMDARVVAFWYPGSNDDLHVTTTIHKNMNEIDEYVLALIHHTKVRQPVLRLAKVFENQIPRKVKEIKIVWD